MKLLHRIHSVMLYPAARVIVTAQSEYQRLRTLGKSPKIHFEEGYNGQPIMLLALYQKGRLRPDLIRLLRVAKAQGLYVLGVNTLKVKQPEELRGLIDCYIERSNFGRDFGSYKTGFLHLFARKWEATCPRLLMLNDSVFYSEKRLPKFLEDMMTSDIEVLGSTENFEIEHHMGSFCISMSNSILNNRNLRIYWQKYQLTDIRPTVIYRGELGLSRALKRCVTNQENFSALYSASRYIQELKDSSEILEVSIQNKFPSSMNPEKAPFFGAIIADFRNRYAFQKTYIGDAMQKIEVQSKNQLDEFYINNFESLNKYLASILEVESVDRKDVHHIATSRLASEFLQGSQIHHNACILLFMGLPIVKNDGLYRGAFAMEDINRICEHLEEDEAKELVNILVSRPFGRSSLIGWKRAAFDAGLI